IGLPGRFLAALHDVSPSAGLTHTIYKYPARFSPAFVREAITCFTVPGDVVLDPFVGSGTSLVEAMALGRHGVGIDINPLATLLTRVKTTLITQEDVTAIDTWEHSVIDRLSLRVSRIRGSVWGELGYQKGLPWPIRKTIELILGRIDELPTNRQRELVR